MFVLNVLKYKKYKAKLFTLIQWKMIYWSYFGPGLLKPVFLTQLEIAPETPWVQPQKSTSKSQTKPSILKQFYFLFNLDVQMKFKIKQTINSRCLSCWFSGSCCGQWYSGCSNTLICIRQNCNIIKTNNFINLNLNFFYKIRFD